MNQTTQMRRKSTPKDIEIVNDPIQYFLDNKRDSVWKKNSEKWKVHFPPDKYSW